MKICENLLDLIKIYFLKSNNMSNENFQFIQSMTLLLAQVQIYGRSFEHK